MLGIIYPIEAGLGRKSGFLFRRHSLPVLPRFGAAKYVDNPGALILQLL
jgi:hypothetical protein